MTSKFHRLDRYISQQLNINRKTVKIMIAQKRIMLDGLFASSQQQIIGPFTHVICDNQILQDQKAIYLILHKPVGVISATKDEQHPTVLDLLPDHYSGQLHIVGRLDLNTSGLLLLTNDGRWSTNITSPEKKISKRYLVTLQNPLNSDYIEAFAQGMYFPFENITTRPAELKIISPHQAQVDLTEGRYHQIKRMFGRFRNPVQALHRISVGPIKLPDDLLPGQFRELTPSEQAHFSAKDVTASSSD